MSDTREDFQKQANEYAETVISNLRDMVGALEHSDECDGECEECTGTGLIADGGEVNGAPEESKCGACDGTGKCTAGKDSDDPESWHDRDRARERIEEDALSVEVRSDWHTPGDQDSTDTEYSILLTTGGPAARIIGELDRYKQPSSAAFEYQDWYKPWTEASTNSSDDEVLLKYAQVFYFGE